MQRKDIIIDDKTFTLTTLNKYGFSVNARQWKNRYDKNHFIVKTVHSIFNKSLFSFSHTPLYVDQISNMKKFSSLNNLRVLDMPIKFPFSSDYRIPKELIQFDEAIAKCASFEAEINPNIEKYYAYLTIDQGRVFPNQFQRTAGCHTDGFQCADDNKNPIGRSYIIHDCIPTVFYPQSFRTDYLNEAEDNFFLAFDDQAIKEAEITFDNYSIVLMNAYTVHRSATTNYPKNRTFFRLTFDTIKFNRFGNTHNPMFEYDWKMKISTRLKNLKHKQLPKYDENAY